jgi:4,5-DOPA dioxygenase extradiol
LNAMSEAQQAAGPGGARMPVLFVGHGSPMNAIEDNAWSRGFRDLARLLPRPGAILAISAHWYVAGTFATANERPETIHDFGGFPDELHRIQYPAPGSPDLARRAVALVGEERASIRTDWGLDHGTWSVLLHLHPAADVPVVQLSIDARLPPAEHLAIGRALAPLRDEGVLLMGSGFLTHNLRLVDWRPDAPVAGWAAEFDAWAEDALRRNDVDALLDFQRKAPGARIALPTTEHYVPVLAALGAAADPAQAPTFPITGFWMGGLTRRSVQWG